MSVIIPKDCFHQPQVADLRLIACPGAEELTNLIDKHLVRWASEAGYQTDSFIIESACPRFQSGDAKGLVKESVRGDDIFIVVDPGNYSVTYKLFNYEERLVDLLSLDLMTVASMKKILDSVKDAEMTSASAYILSAINNAGGDKKTFKL